MFIRSRLSHYSSRIFKEYNRSICESQLNFGIVFRLLSCTDKHGIFTTLLTLSFYPYSVMLGRGNVANKKSPRQGLWPHSEGKKVSCSGMGETSTGRRRKDCFLQKEINLFDGIVILDYIVIHFWADFKRGNVNNHFHSSHIT